MAAISSSTNRPSTQTTSTAPTTQDFAFGNGKVSPNMTPATFQKELTASINAEDQSDPTAAAAESGATFQAGGNTYDADTGRLLEVGVDPNAVDQETRLAPMTAQQSGDTFSQRNYSNGDRKKAETLAALRAV